MALSPQQNHFLLDLRHYLGVPYVWGGTSMQGVDCSGLVWAAARQAGIRGVPRTSFEQFRVGQPVAMNQLRPGDLIFSNFEGPGAGASHVVIYIGNGKIIQAAHSGTNVSYAPLSVLAGHIVGARRIVANAGTGQVVQSGKMADAQNAYFQQQTGGRSLSTALSALSMIHPIQVGQFQPLPTAHQTLQNLAQPGAPIQPGVQPMQSSMVTGPAGVAAQLGAIHQRLLNTSVPPPRLNVGGVKVGA